jgi:hypothetical protein
VESGIIRLVYFLHLMHRAVDVVVVVVVVDTVLLLLLLRRMMGRWMMVSMFDGGLVCHCRHRGCHSMCSRNDDRTQQDSTQLISIINTGSRLRRLGTSY